MRRSLAVSLCLSVSPALAEGVIVVSPVYSQLVAFAVPEGFKAGFEHEERGSYLLELIPQAETVEDWSQMITLSGGKGLADKLSVVDVASQLAEGYQAACPSTFSARSLPAPKVKGAKAVFAGYLGCGDVGGRSEAMAFVVLQGAAEIYTVQWAERGAPQSKAMEPAPEVWRPRADALALSRVCDKVAGEAAPYPSCTQ